MISYCLDINGYKFLKRNIPLLTTHTEETCMFEGEQINPDWPVYKALDEANALKVVGVWDDQEVVGYSINTIVRHPHYDFQYAVNDAIYLKKEHRGRAIKLIKHTETIMRDCGAKYFSISVKPHIDFRPVLERFGYKPLEYTYFRRL